MVGKIAKITYHFFGNVKKYHYLCNVKGIEMRTFEITMDELGKDGKVRTITQTAICRNRRQVIEWYGLNQPDILSYTITEKI